MNNDSRVLTIEDTMHCPSCDESKVENCRTASASGTTSGGTGKARYGSYRRCDGCGVTFVTGDIRLPVDGRQYLLHLSHGVGPDELAGKLVTGPWGATLAPGERPGDRVILKSNDMPHDTGVEPLEHIEEIAAAVRVKRPS